jgi:hypothetical protein
MTLPEAAAFLCHSPRQVRDMVKLRRLPACNLSARGRGKLLFRLQDLRAAVERWTQQAA